MGLFQKKKEPLLPSFPPEDFEPVLRCSICTGEQVACMRERRSGRLRELMLICSEEDLAEFCRIYRVTKESLRRIY